MKKTIKLQVEQSELREKLNTILAIEEELTDERRVAPPDTPAPL